jgi:hypothetical protein
LNLLVLRRRHLALRRRYLVCRLDFDRRRKLRLLCAREVKIRLDLGKLPRLVDLDLLLLEQRLARRVLLCGGVDS